MDAVAAPAGPWLLSGVVLGLSLAAIVAVAVVRLRAAARPTATPAPTGGGRDRPDGPPWQEDDLPGFLDFPPGAPGPLPSPPDVGGGPRPIAPATVGTAGPATAQPPSLAPTAAGTTGAVVGAPHRDRGLDRSSTRPLVALSALSVLLVGAAAAVAAWVPAPVDPATARGSSGGPTGARDAERPPPAWAIPALPAPPDRPGPEDPGAGLLATRSVPVGATGALLRSSFEGLVLERRAVGVTAAYPTLSLTAAEVPGGPALAHVRLPVWNCLADHAPADPVSAGCRRLPTRYADLPAPALAVGELDGGLRVSGRFPTYVRPAGSAPEWTGQVYALTFRVSGDRGTVSGSVHLGTERAGARADPALSELRRGG